MTLGRESPWLGVEQGRLGAPGPGHAAAVVQTGAHGAWDAQLGLSWEDGVVCVHEAAPRRC